MPGAPASLKAEFKQFKKLLRNNSYRLLDNELVAPEGDLAETLAHVLALLAAFGVAVCALLAFKHVSVLLMGGPLPGQREAIFWPIQEFFIALAMLVTACTFSVTWDGLFPDRRDSMVLCALPIRMRTLFAAKAASILTLLLLLVVSTNALPFIAVPFLIAPDQGLTGLACSAAAHIGVIFAASALVFFGLLAFQGILINVMSYRLFQRTSPYFQLAIPLVFLLMFFLMPPIANPRALADPRNQQYLRFLPSLWFLGLYQQLLGCPYPVVARLADSAKLGLVISAALAAVMYWLGYRTQVRKAIEEADLVPGGLYRRGLALTSRIGSLFLRAPVERAVFHFAARTMTRNKKHRLFLAAYLGAGLAYVLSDVATAVRHGGGALHRPNAVLVSVPLILTFFVLLGMRVLFAIPTELKANWIFQLTESGSVKECHRAVRRLMLLFGLLPIAAATFPVYGLLWGWKTALLHLLALLLAAVLMIEMFLRRFPKIPFTCSFLPGKANLSMKLGPYWVWFSLVSLVLIQVELQMLRNTTFFATVFCLGCAVLAALIVNRKKFERQQYGFVYEEKPLELPITLELHS
jgi:hypothetical protein